MKIHFASDHAGFELKKALIEHIKTAGHEVVDHGPMEYNESDDYPDFITPCAQAVSTDTGSLGIIAGFSGEGEAMCANRIKGIRATVYYGGAPKILTLSREHNNANILSLSQHFMTDPEAIDAVDLWLATPFSGDERHVRRINKLDKENDFDTWNNRKKFIHEKRQEGLFQERDVIWCSVGKNIGFEQDGKGTDFRRPILVVKKYNKHVFFGVPISTKMKPENKYYFEIRLQDTIPRSLILSQARLFDAKRLTQKVGVLDKEQFEQTKNALARTFGFSA